METITTMETEMEIIRAEERVDDLQLKNYRIIQNPGRFCFGMDAVLLSDFAQLEAGKRALDLGTGTGIIPILMAGKTQGEHFTGLEIQPDSADMAKRSVILNNLQDKIDIIEGDIKEVASIFNAASFDVVTSNPPYMINEHGLKNPESPKAIARHEVSCNLRDVVAAAAKMLKPGGHFYMVHRPFRLTEILCIMHELRVEPKRMRLIYPFVDREPNMVLIEGVRGGKPRMTVESPLIIYEKTGEYTQEVMDIYYGKETAKKE